MNDNPQTIIVAQRMNRNWLLIAVTGIIIAFLWMTCNGYKNGQAQLAASKEIKEVVKRMKEDSIKAAAVIDQLRKDTARSNEAIEDINFNAEILEDSLNRSEVNTAFLAHRIKELVKTLNSKVDTIELTNNCEDVADAYLKELDINKAFRLSKDSLQKSMQERIILGDSISSVWQNRYLATAKGYNDLVIAASKIRPSVNVKIGLSGVYSVYIAGIGPCFALEDCKGRLFAGSVNFTNHGKLYEGKVLFPISFRKR
jgi:hypothetical protein